MNTPNLEAQAEHASLLSDYNRLKKCLRKAQRRNNTREVHDLTVELRTKNHALLHLEVKRRKKAS